ncbi:hypothetical protein [Pseudofrankia inefficax]|uniref:hypothetical protein n=1 Tax=Pseudofrankia inefficax (strain DSM 45817 / CECT 9037 / DDB 130130 / EuI1c) TaxID=298654 RepID=UPI0012FD865C|nr:hypothetical protein [Pseudofrankia inefficax]
MRLDVEFQRHSSAVVTQPGIVEGPGHSMRCRRGVVPLGESGVDPTSGRYDRNVDKDVKQLVDALLSRLFESNARILFVLVREVGLERHEPPLFLFAGET